MTRTSSGSKKSGPPAHANKFAYTHNRNSKLTKQILAMPISGVCIPCREVIEWRKKFRKYKPLTVPKKCVKCEQKTVKEAYHVICNPCSAKLRACAKCLTTTTANQSSNENVTEEEAGSLPSVDLEEEFIDGDSCDESEGIDEDDEIL